MHGTDLGPEIEAGLRYGKSVRHAWHISRLHGARSC